MFPSRTSRAERLTPAICAGIDRVRTIRAVIGGDIDLMVDCHSRFNPGILIQVAKELEGLAPLLD